MRRNPRILIQSALAIALLLLLLQPAFAFAESAPTISSKELAARRTSGDAPIVIDVRTPKEFALEHVPGALNIPYDEIAKRITEVDAPHGVALYCMIGPRARKGEAALFASGYKNVLHLEGGLAGWKAAGLAVESGGSGE